MRTTNPLDTLIEQSRKARDQAGRTLADDRNSEQQAALQLDTLQEYRREYQRKLQDALVQGVNVTSLHNYQRFIYSLDHAIDNAGNNLRQHNDKVDSSKQSWRQRQKRLSSYDTLADRRATRQRQHEAKQEQRQTDELSNNNQARRRTGSPSV